MRRNNLPGFLFGLVKSEVRGVLVYFNQVVFPLFTRPEFQSTAFHQTLVLENSIQVSIRYFPKHHGIVLMELQARFKSHNLGFIGS